jgi:hypothetical protein
MGQANRYKLMLKYLTLIIPVLLYMYSGSK